MMKNVMMALAFCLCTATLFAQQNVNAADAQGISTSRNTQYTYNRTRDDKPRRSPGELMDSIRNSPNWNAEREAFSAEFYNSAAWKNLPGRCRFGIHTVPPAIKHGKMRLVRVMPS